jgi:hypothetical protein
VQLQQRQLGRSDRGAKNRTITALLLPTRTRTNQPIVLPTRRKQDAATRQNELFPGVFDQQISLWQMATDFTLEVLALVQPKAVPQIRRTLKTQ